MGAPAGLQRERTMLAWERTVLSTLVAALTLGRAWLSWSPLAALVNAVLAAAAALVVLRRRRAGAVGSATAGAAFGVVALGVTELVLLIWRS